MNFPLPHHHLGRDDSRRLQPVTHWQARVSQEAPRFPWNAFMSDVFDWENGEHVALIGPTGQGKTTLLMKLLPLHDYRVVFATKPHDRTMDKLIAEGYKRMEYWQPLDAKRYPHRVLWPPAHQIDSEDIQRQVFETAMGKIYREKGWTVALDEGWYFTNILKLSKQVKTFLLQGRSLGISLVFATQRPANVPLEVYDQSTHLFFWRDNDERNLSRLSGISWRSADLIRYIVSNLDMHQVLYINTRTGKMARTRAPFPD